MAKLLHRSIGGAAAQVLIDLPRNVGRPKGSRLVGLLLPLVLAGCGSSDEQALEQMIENRVGKSGYVSISDVVVYRSGDEKLACLAVQRRNNWGETLPLERVIAWYVWKSETWHFSNFEPIRDSCEEHSKRGPAERAQEAERERAATNQQMADFLARDQQQIDAGTRALEARIKAEEDAAAARSVVAEQQLAERIAREDAERDAGAARMDAELNRDVKASIDQPR